MLRVRLIYGISLALLIIGLLLADGYLATLHPTPGPSAGIGGDPSLWVLEGAVCNGVIGVLVWLTAREVAHLARALGCQPNVLLAQFGAVALAVAPYVTFNAPAALGIHAESWGMLVVTVALALAFARQARRHGTHGVMANLASTMFVICYAGGLASFLSRLRMEVGGAGGIAALLFSVFVVKMADTGAFFVGSLIGRRKLIPWLSPNKTWEGFIAGLVVAVLCAVGVGHWLHLAGWLPLTRGPLASTSELAFFGLVMGLLSVAGDLSASLLKREAAVKDSGQALPGLGGILDVMDSPLLAAPAAWFFWTCVLPL